MRNILRETGNHNAALLAKEAEESQARLKRLREKTERLNAHSEDKSGDHDHDDDYEDAPRAHKRRRTDGNEEDDDERRRRHHHRSSHGSRKSGRHDKEERDSKHRRRRKHEESEEESDKNIRHSKHRRRRKDEEPEEPEEESDKNNRHSKHKRRRKHEESEEDGDKPDPKSNQSNDKQRSGDEPDRYPTVLSRKGRKEDGSWQHIRFRSRSSSRARSPDYNSQKKSFKQRRSSATSDKRSTEPRSKNPGPPDGRKIASKEEAAASDSDPLEAIVGPLPKSQPQPKIIKFRGRGAFSTTSAIDTHFASSYDPTVDVRPNSDEEDEWGLAVEAYRDRQKWKQQGAERLKAAGFTDEQVRRWEKGGEKTEEDVKWSKSGEGREWDRGKVMDEEGDVDIKAEWGRLKGT